MNWTERNWSGVSKPEFWTHAFQWKCSQRTNLLSTKRSSFGAVMSWRWRAWPMNASCNWGQFSSVQFVCCQEAFRATVTQRCCRAALGLCLVTCKLIISPSTRRYWIVAEQFPPTTKDDLRPQSLFCLFLFICFAQNKTTVKFHCTKQAGTARLKALIKSTFKKYKSLGYT